MTTANSSPFDTAVQKASKTSIQIVLFSVWQIQAHKVMVQKSDLDDKGTREPIL